MNKKANNYSKTFILISLAINIITLAALFVTLHTVNDLSKIVSAQQEQIFSLAQKEVKPFATNLATLTLKENVTQQVAVAKPQEPKTTIDNKRETINGYVREITSLPKYSNIRDLTPELVMSIIQQESTYRPDAKNGDCLGLMQVSSYWHSKRAERLGVKDFYDPYGNILVGVDYLSDLIKYNEDVTLALMLYSMDNNTAYKLHAEGKSTSYSRTVLARAEEYKKRE
jgi:soluble lytic murein transglycosylase-like protein